MYNSKLKAEGVWVHPTMGYTSHDKKEGYIYFSSKSELAAWIKIRNIFSCNEFDVNRQSKLTSGSLSWKIDFRIDAYQHKQKLVLAQIANMLCPHSQYNTLNTLFIEYKGYQDSNFLKKFTSIVDNAPMLARTIILCSNRPEGYVKEDKIKHQIYMHPIVSMEYLEAIAISCIRAILK